MQISFSTQQELDFYVSETKNKKTSGQGRQIKKIIQPDNNWNLATFTIHLKGTGSQVAYVGSGNWKESVSFPIKYVWFCIRYVEFSM